MTATMERPTATTVTVTTASLLAALNGAHKLISFGRPAVPALAGVLIETGNGHGLTISAFDYENSLCWHLPSLSAPTTEFRIVVNATTLRALLKGHGKKDCTELRCADGRLHVTTNEQTGTLVELVPVDEYPTLPEPGTPRWQVDGALLSETVARVALAASRSDEVPTLNGALLTVEGDRLHLVATDRYRLAWDQLPVERVHRSEAPDRVVVPAPAVAAVGALLREGPVRIGFAGPAGTSVTFTGDGVTITARPLDGSFPKYESLFPAGDTETVEVGRDALIAAVNHAKVAAVRNTPVRLEFTPGQVVVTGGVDAGEDQLSATVSVEGDLTFATAYNPKYLLDGLRGQPERVTFTVTHPHKPAVLSAPERDYRYLLMPVRVAQ